MKSQAFKNYLLNRVLLTADELKLIQSLAVEKRVAKKDCVLKAGDVCKDLIFVSKGLMRLVRIDKEGNEHILKFANENRWISDRESYLTGKPANCSIEAIEHSVVLVWRKDDFRNLLAQIPTLKLFMKNLTENSQIANQNRIFSYISTSAEEKYLEFVATNPTVFNRLPLHMVASYLGVTRETLSRLRRCPTKG